MERSNYLCLSVIGGTTTAKRCVRCASIVWSVPTVGKVWRIYADGHEFGRDFQTLKDAREVKAEFAALFPKVRYYIRAVRRE